MNEIAIVALLIFGIIAIVFISCLTHFRIEIKIGNKVFLWERGEE